MYEYMELIPADFGWEAVHKQHESSVPHLVTNTHAHIHT